MINAGQKQELLRLWLIFVRAFNAYMQERGLPTVDFDPNQKNGTRIICRASFSVQKRDKDGKFAKEGGSGGKGEKTDEETAEQVEAESKIGELDKIDFTKEATLPGLTSGVQKRYGLKDKPVRLKTIIIKRNNQRHPDVTEEDAKRIIGLSLYKPEKVFESDLNDYLCFVSTAKEGRYSDVVLDVEETADSYDIVHFYWLNDKKLRKIERLNREI